MLIELTFQNLVSVTIASAISGTVVLAVVVAGLVILSRCVRTCERVYYIIPAPNSGKSKHYQSDNFVYRGFAVVAYNHIYDPIV